jgi:hypothetical protein
MRVRLRRRLNESSLSARRFSIIWPRSRLCETIMQESVERLEPLFKPDSMGPGSLVDDLPRLYFAVNRVLEESLGPALSRKEGTALVMLATSASKDEIGPYYTTKDLIESFRSWHLASDLSAAPVVSKTKQSLFAAGYIMIAGGRDRIRLTPSGLAMVHSIHQRLAGSLENIMPKAQIPEILSLLANRSLQPKVIQPERVLESESSDIQSNPVQIADPASDILRVELVDITQLLIEQLVKDPGLVYRINPEQFEKRGS